MQAAFLWKWEWICSEILCLVSWPDLSWDFDRKPLVKLSIHFKFNHKNNGIFTLIGQGISLLTFRGNWRSSQGKARQGKAEMVCNIQATGPKQDRGYISHRAKQDHGYTSRFELRLVAQEGCRRYNGNTMGYQATPGDTRRYQTIDSRRFSSYVQVDIAAH